MRYAIAVLLSFGAIAAFACGSKATPIDSGTLGALKTLLAKRLADADATLPE